MHSDGPYKWITLRPCVVQKSDRSAGTRLPASRIVLSFGKFCSSSVVKYEGEKPPVLGLRLSTALGRFSKRSDSEGIQTQPQTTRGQKTSNIEKSKLQAVIWRVRMGITGLIVSLRAFMVVQSCPCGITAPFGMPGNFLAEPYLMSNSRSEMKGRISRQVTYL